MQARKRSRPQTQPFQFSLHVRHPSIDPEDISRELQLTAAESFKAGQPRTSRSGVAATAVHGETYWVAVIDPALWPALAAARHGGGRAEQVGGTPTREEPLPADRHSRLRLLVMLGKEQGYLSRGQVSAYLPAEVLDPTQIEDVIRTLAELGIHVVEDTAVGEPQAQAALANLGPQEARILRTRFGLGVAGIRRNLGAALSLVCENLLGRHRPFLRALRAQGGSVTLEVTLSANAQGSFRLTPELGHGLSELGITLEFDFAGDAR